MGFSTNFIWRLTKQCFAKRLEDPKLQTEPKTASTGRLKKIIMASLASPHILRMKPEKNPFYQTYSKTTVVLSKKPFLQRDHNQSYFDKSWSPAKQTLKYMDTKCTSSEYATTVLSSYHFYFSSPFFNKIILYSFLYFYFTCIVI